MHELACKHTVGHLVDELASRLDTAPQGVDAAESCDSPARHHNIGCHFGGVSCLGVFAAAASA